MLLSEFMVKTQGFIIPTTKELILETPKYQAMIVDIIYSCWDACTKTDPKDPEAKLFVPNAIISNPVTYAHIHCAEALGVPLHMMFPQVSIYECKHIFCNSLTSLRTIAMDTNESISSSFIMSQLSKRMVCRELSILSGKVSTDDFLFYPT
jgi:hypothetical protein